jgi:hypothetical protein
MDVRGVDNQLGRPASSYPRISSAGRRSLTGDSTTRSVIARIPESRDDCVEPMRPSSRLTGGLRRQFAGHKRGYVRGIRVSHPRGGLSFCELFGVKVWAINGASETLASTVTKPSRAYHHGRREPCSCRVGLTVKVTDCGSWAPEIKTCRKQKQKSRSGSFSPMAPSFHLEPESI